MREHVSSIQTSERKGILNHIYTAATEEAGQQEPLRTESAINLEQIGILRKLTC